MPNPVTNLDANGRRVRHCRRSVGLMTVRTDHEAQYALKFAKETLAGSMLGDSPSVSMIMRRALQVYRRYLASEMSTPCGLEAEYKAIRRDTIMPMIRKHR
jgi:hypothetical protein